MPGEPETWIVEGPPALSHSRNASFTYNGSDLQSLPHEIVYECRIDTQDPFAWEDCEYPAEWMNLSPGEHFVEIRAIDMLGAGLADSSPARHVWTYQPLPAGDPPEVFLDLKPEPKTWVLDAIFTFHSNEPDVTFECKVDEFGYEPCGFDTVADMDRGGFEWGFERGRGRPAHLLRPRDRLRGQRRRADDLHVEPARHRHRVPARPEPASRRASRRPRIRSSSATGGETLSTTAVIAFEANMADATFECSLDLQPFEPCTSPVTYEDLLPGDHILRVIATAGEVSELEAAEYEWAIVEGIDTAPPRRSIERRPPSNSSSTQFEFTGTDDQTPPELLVFECRVDSTNELDWEECVSPFNLLDLYTYEDPQMAPGQHTFEVRAIDTVRPAVREPEQPELRGQPRPDAGHLHVDDDGGQHAADHGHHLRAGERRQGRLGRIRRPVLRLRRQRQRDARSSSSSSSASSTSSRGSRARRRPSSSDLEPGQHTLRDPRDRPGAQRRPDARGAHLHGRADAADDDHVRPGHAATPRASASASSRPRRSSSAPTSPARRSSAASTAARPTRRPTRTGSRRAPRRSPTSTSRRASTSSRSARSTPRA